MFEYGVWSMSVVFMAFHQVTHSLSDFLQETGVENKTWPRSSRNKMKMNSCMKAPHCLLSCLHGKYMQRWMMTCGSCLCADVDEHSTSTPLTVWIVFHLICIASDIPVWRSVRRVYLSVSVCVCVCVCVCVREGKRERERVCVCVWEREGKRGRVGIW